MILHVGHLEKFIPPFVKLIDEQFSDQKHQFWLAGSIAQYPVPKRKTVFVRGTSFWKKLTGYTRLLIHLHQAKKVVLHGLVDNKVVGLLTLCPWVLPKCYWVIWGGDLYRYQKTLTTWRSHVTERLRRFVIRRVGHLITYIKGDVELARKWYGATGNYHECLMYLSNVVDPKMTVESEPISDHKGWNILLGNSADPSNNHIEALQRLIPFKDQNIKIYAPLSYGDKNHAQNVIRQGKEWFGEKFVPMTDFMPFEEYQEFLKGLDIAIFNHQRQQAMGNTITLLGMGKTVFLRGDVSQWELFKNEGISVFDFERDDLKLLAAEDAVQNARLVRKKFSRDKLVDQYARIFDS